MTNKDRGVIGGTFADVVQKSTTWALFLGPLTLAYLAAAFYVVWTIKPATRFFGMLAGQAETYLLDLFFVGLPLVGLITGYVSFQNANQRHAREDFLATHDATDLVQARINRNLIYKILERGPSDSIARMQVVWTPNGLEDNGTIYTDPDPQGVIRLDTNRFIEN